MRRKTGIFTQNQFFLCSSNSKTNHCKYLTFSPNVFINVITYLYTVKFSKYSFFELFIDFLDAPNKLQNLIQDFLL